jgi:hypothetical protein
VWVVAAPSDSQGTWRLEETLRIGSDADGPYLFADIRGVVPGASGSIFVLDYKAQEIRLFDATGRFVQQVARRGSGPGEIKDANGLLVAPNGDVWVNDPANARWSVFSPGGTFLRQHTIPILGFGYIWNGVIDTAGIVFDPVSVPGEGRTYRQMIRRVRPDGHVVDSLPGRGCELRGTGGQPAYFSVRSRTGGGMMQIPFLPSPVRVIDRRGSTWCSSRDRYEVLQIHLERGDTLRRISLATQPVAVPRAERDSEVAKVRAFFTKMGAPEPDYGRIPSVKPAIETIDVDSRGRLWVRPSTADTTKTRLDIWEPGAPRPVTVLAPWRISQWVHAHISNDTLFTWILDESDAPVVVRAVLRRQGGGAE